MKKNQKTEKVPAYSILIEATFQALKQLGGSGHNDEINKTVYEILNVSDDILEILHTGRTSFSEIDYRLAWARTLLKNYGAIYSSERKVWAITGDYQQVENVDGTEVEKCRNSSIKNGEILLPETKPIEENAELPIEVRSWREHLFDILVNMNPYAFERLTQKLLRECGLTDVNVTKKSGDGGVDGYGKLKANGLVSFNIAFQCKRYQGSVGAPEIRDFRGSLTANVEKGIFITTGTFSKQAREEAETTCKQQIDLIDGEAFMDLLAENNIGLKEVKDYEIDEEFFKKI